MPGNVCCNVRYVAKNTREFCFRPRHITSTAEEDNGKLTGPAISLDTIEISSSNLGKFAGSSTLFSNWVQYVSEKEPNVCLRLFYSPRLGCIPLKLRAWHLVFLNSSTDIISLRTCFLDQSNYPNRIQPRNSHVTKGPLWLKKKSCQTRYELAPIIFPLGRKLSLNCRLAISPKRIFLCQWSESETMPNRFMNRGSPRPPAARSTNSDRM